MNLEQPNLFQESVKADPEGINTNVNQEPASFSYDGVPFLPGVNGQEAFPDVSGYNELELLGKNCSACRLRSTCGQVVFGSGNLKSPLLIIGEGPGQDEDIQGVPFVGRAGQLLDKILQASEIERQQIYITNVVKCRPPGNRLPNPDEVKMCGRFLEAQIRLMKPELIVCLGSLASQTVISPKVKITQIRGQWLSRQGCRIIATFHPAALLRNPSYKRPVWEDFKSIRDVYKSIV
ncbi:MAG: uracil-DNA glycosylase [Syntrophomonadaceae bacterium]|nr:uracil-DNA glycosylase [Syntrophomonadaceae bacterium]